METNTIYCGDCRDILTNHFSDGYVDLIYVDPPFFSERHYAIVWGNGYERRAFEDRWKAGKGSGGIKNYIAWMEPKVRECHRVLKNAGTMFLHCDWHADAHLRILMDGIFGEPNFINEIVCQAPRQSGAGTSSLYGRSPRNHLRILRRSGPL